MTNFSIFVVCQGHYTIVMQFLKSFTPLHSEFLLFMAICQQILVEKYLEMLSYSVNF